VSKKLLNLVLTAFFVPSHLFFLLAFARGLYSRHRFIHLSRSSSIAIVSDKPHDKKLRGSVGAASFLFLQNKARIAYPR
jgi:hypothetical protein